MDYQKAVWEAPLPMLLLCVRENQRQTDKNGMTLQDKEMIDELMKKEKRHGNK